MTVLDSSSDSNGSPLSTANRPDELVFLSLGGAGEIGMNLNLYGYAGKWLMVDCGVTFGDNSTPGIDVVLPDPEFIVERRDALVGLVVTHAHEDHIGAIPYIWRQLRCPVYATPFTAAVLRAKLAENDLVREVPIHEVPLSGTFRVGPFAIELITLTHSIPEPNAVVIRTPVGAVLHTGDWKFDPDPLVGPTADEAALRRLGDDGVLAMICDSTNALRSGEAGSEADVRGTLVDLIGRCRNRVAVACFASNIARLESVAAAAAEHDRHVALIGRSLWRMERAARETGYLRDLPAFISEEDAGYLPREKVVLVCTGSQGEPRSALARIADDDHPHVVLEEGDAVIFSSRIIPGNELAIGRLQNKLARLGVEVLTETDHPSIHVSGHPAREELTRMYQLVRPRIAIPVHGEARHLIAHARLAEECQVPTAIVAENGEMVRLGPGPAEIIGEVQVGRLGIDGKQLRPLGSTALRDRTRISFNGSAVATLVLDAKGRLLAPPQVTVHGIADEDDELLDVLEDDVGRAIDGMPASDRRDDDAVREAARIAIRRTLKAAAGKRPVTDVHVVRV
jgi:ribonuclease J